LFLEIPYNNLLVDSINYFTTPNKQNINTDKEINIVLRRRVKIVILGDGRYELPDHLFYSKDQHLFLDKLNCIIGLDQIGYHILKEPFELKVLVETEVKAGEPFATIATATGITTLISPCSGKIKMIHEDALELMENDSYVKGILELENISDVKSNLITGEEIEPWAVHEIRSLLKNEYNQKIILIGDSGTGKTAIKVRFTGNYFKKDLKTTLGVDFGSKSIECEYIPEDLLFSGTYKFIAKINVWDAAGQAHFDKIRGMYYRDTKGALLVYDVNNLVSFENLEKWIDELEDNLGTVPTAIIGNKTDLERKVPKEMAMDLAKKHGFLYAECSAKTSENVEKVFQQIALKIYKKEENINK
jgi:small GTP-binding protein